MLLLITKFIDSDRILTIFESALFQGWIPYSGVWKCYNCRSKSFIWLDYRLPKLSYCFSGPLIFWVSYQRRSHIESWLRYRLGAVIKAFDPWEIRFSTDINYIASKSSLVFHHAGILCRTSSLDTNQYATSIFALKSIGGFCHTWL